MPDTIHVILPLYINTSLFMYTKPNLFIEPEVENNLFRILPYNILCFSSVTLPCLLHFWWYVLSASSTSLHIAWSKHKQGCFAEGLRNIESKLCSFMEWVASGAMSFRVLRLFMIDRPAKINLLENILHEHNIPSHYMKLLPHVTLTAKKGLLLTL